MIVLARAERRNAVSIAMWQMLRDAVAQVETEEATRVVLVISECQNAFSVGADIGEFAQLATNEARRRDLQSGMQDACDALERCSKPTIAVIDGVCVGAGCSIAVACDFRIASERARFAVTPAKLGLLYGLADTRRLAAAIGPVETRRLLFTGAMIDAQRALSINLVDEVHAPERLLAAASACAAEMACRSGATIAATKRALLRIAAGERFDDEELQAEFRDAFRQEEVLTATAAFLARADRASPSTSSTETALGPA